MTDQQKKSEIATLETQIAALDEQASRTKTEIRKLIEKRDTLNAQFKKLREEIRELKGERDSLNEKVQIHKLLRDETRKKTHTIIEDIKTRRSRITELKNRTPRRSYRELQKELEDIEWKIQTTSLPLQEEKRLIEGVRQLETEMEAYKKIEHQTNKIAELQEELTELDRKGDGFHQELSDMAQKSQEIHQKMINKITESRTIKEEADKLHSAYLETKEKTAPSNAELRRLAERKKRLQDSLREEEERERKTKEQALKDKLESQARDKLQRGEKLSWEEFKLLSEDDSKTQD